MSKGIYYLKGHSKSYPKEVDVCSICTHLIIDKDGFVRHWNKGFYPKISFNCRVGDCNCLEPKLSLRNKSDEVKE